MLLDLSQSTDTQTYLVGRDADISDPLECLHFAAILLRLAQYGSNISSKLPGLEAKFVAITNGQSWTKKAQLEKKK